MTVVVGIDLSLTSTGLARVAGGRVTTSLATSSGKLKDTLEQRFVRQTLLTNSILEFVKGSLPDLVVIEGLFSSGQVGGSQLDRFGLWWRVVGSLLLWEIPTTVVTATQAKKFLAGSGKADKGSMVRAAGKLWPDWEPSTTHSSEDEADAIALASVGVALHSVERDLEVPFTMPEYRHEIIAKLTKEK